MGLKYIIYCFSPIICSYIFAFYITNPTVILATSIIFCIYWIVVGYDFYGEFNKAISSFLGANLFLIIGFILYLLSSWIPTLKDSKFNFLVYISSTLVPFVNNFFTTYLKDTLLSSFKEVACVLFLCALSVFGYFIANNKKNRNRYSFDKNLLR